MGAKWGADGTQGRGPGKCSLLPGILDPFTNCDIMDLHQLSRVHQLSSHMETMAAHIRAQEGLGRAQIHVGGLF